ncbi:LysM peptidoglycan-binding domain-containing protein [Sulfitobacter sp. HNIBRBA2951]|uniref:LysM peptidoglycan-binding domain-containing protein n=1 Tax=Sulfitobacter aquimarinus TaxID=3158557 RepID=UPI0032DF3361
MFTLKGAFLSAALALSPAVAFAQATLNCGQSYTVAPGDTLTKISTRAYGVSAFGVLVEANKKALGDNPNLLFVGQKLMIPCRGAAPVVAEAAATAPEPVVAAPNDGPVLLTFNKASDPRFVINTGIIEPFLQRLEMATEGRVRFVDPPMMNRDPQAQFDLVTSGQVDAAYVFNGYLTESHPLLQLPMIPLMGGSAEQTAVSLWNLHDRYLSKSDYFSDAHLVGFVAAPTSHIWHRQVDPIVAGDGRIARNDYPVPYFDGLDTIGPKRVQDRNKEKFGNHNEDVDGKLTFMMAHGAARAGAIWTPERGVTEVENGIYTPTFSVIISNEAWARISSTDQQIITALAGLALSQRSAAWDAFDNGHRQIMLDGGLDVSYPDGPLLRELEEAAQAKLAVWAQEAEKLGIPSEQAIASYRANLASLRYLLIFR